MFLLSLPLMSYVPLNNSLVAKHIKKVHDVCGADVREKND